MATDTVSVPPSDFLGLISPEERADLLARAHVRHFRARQFVFRGGSPGENVYIMADGRAKIFGLSKKEVILWFCFPGEIFGLAEVLRGGPRAVYAQACSDCRLYAIAQGEFKRFLSDHPNAAMLVIDMLACRLRVLGDMMQNLTTDDVATRVAKLLMRLCARYGQRVNQDIKLDIKLTHQEIGDMIGANRQTVTVILGDLKRQGAIRIENHCICVQRPERLERLAGLTTLPANDDIRHGKVERQ